MTTSSGFVKVFPEDPNTQIVRFLGPKIHTLSGFVWTLKPYYLGTWTLRVLQQQKLNSAP